jgi:Sulfotransferase family
MLISHDKKFLFIHIQKTAGSSMTSLLGETVPDFAQYLGTHDHAAWAKNQSDFVWGDYFKVAFVRNPWDRLVSWYMMIVQNAEHIKASGGLNGLWSYVLDNSASFEEFVCQCTATIDDTDGKKSFLFNQLDYVSDGSGKIIVDFIGRFEALERDAAVVFERLGLSGVTLPHHNVSQRKHYRDYYNDETRDIVAQRYARDIQFFDYEF